MNSKELIRSRLTVLDPIVTSNIYAFEAPPGGWGEYKHRSIMNILSTAYTAFYQIVMVEKEKSLKMSQGGNNEENNEAAPAAEDNVEPIASIPIELHIGYWGCGAYGGNPILMVLIQLLAAKLAGIEFVTKAKENFPDS
jgi:hypothetical protein